MILNTALTIKNKNTRRIFKNKKYSNSVINTNSLEEKVYLLIIRDLRRLNWKINSKENKIEIIPPKYYDKEIIKSSMSIKRSEIIRSNLKWINENIGYARENLADGNMVLKSLIKPYIEICTTNKQHDLFRLYRYYWSSPYSEYVGRRIKILFRDAGLPNNPVIGIAALGSPIIHIPERDDFIGWDKDTRTKRLNYMMDAYVIGALPPYNYLLGGKLVSMLLFSKEVREIYNKKYKETSYSKLVGLFTTSLYGKSSQYNRLSINGRKIYEPIGDTKGYGTLHLTTETINAMLDLLKEKKINISNAFGNGPSWTMRVIRAVGDLLGFDSDQLLMHSFKRKIYFVPFAKNTINYLNNKNKKIYYFDENIDTLTNYWKERWLNNRKSNIEIIQKVKAFKEDDFII